MAEAATGSHRTRVVGALVIVYLVWGSVYLAIRLVIDEVDVFQAMAQRFALAAVLLAVIVAIRSGPRALLVTRRQLWNLALLGVLLLGLGNGLQALGQHHGVPSGVAALLVAGVPLWAVMLRALSGDRPSARTVAGVGAGLVGLLVLIIVGGHGAGGEIPLGAAMLVMTASFAWTLGSFLQGRSDLPSDTFVVAAHQQAVACVCSVVFALGTGERFSVDYSVRGWAALGYLIVVCSVVGFSAFAWLLRNAPLSLVATHAYVNPVVAVALGWLVLGEPVTWAIGVGGGVVVASVVLVVSAERA